MASRVPPRFRHLRHNPPLSEHMANDDLAEIAHDLHDRLQDDPRAGLDFVIRCLSSVSRGISEHTHYHYEQTGILSGEEISEHLYSAANHLHDAFARLKHSRR